MKCAETNTTEKLTIREENIIKLPLGLLGFEEYKKFVLLSHPEEAPFLWLQVIVDPELAFLVVAPSVVTDDYEPDLSEDDARALDLRTSEDAMVFNIVTLRGEDNATVNLKGPIVVNRRTLQGKQVIPVNAADLPVNQPLSINP